MYKDYRKFVTFIVSIVLSLSFSLLSVQDVFGAVTTEVVPNPQLQQPIVLWAQKAGRQPIDIQTGDIDGDGAPDVVVGYSEPNILAVNSFGDVLWNFPTQNWVWHVAIGDIDGDRKNDVAGYEAQRPSFLYALTSSGAQLWNYQLPITGSGNQFADHVEIGDVDGDGKNEVVVGADAADTLFIFDSLGSVLLNYSLPAHGIASIELADMTGDSAREIVISYGGRCLPCGIQVIDGQGNLVWDFPAPIRLGDAAVGDVNGDKKPDVVVAEWDSSRGHKVFAIDNSGSLLWEFELQGEATSIALGNINSDGESDVIVGSSDGHVYAIDNEGQLIWSFDAGDNVVKVDVGDLDGDGIFEIAAATMGGGPIGGVYALNPNGSLMWFFPQTPSEDVQGFRDLITADLDSDGCEEVVAIQDDLGSGENGLIYALSSCPIPIEVLIDVKPGSDPNSINCNKEDGVIPVAILATEAFDANTLDHTTVTFEGASEIHIDKKSGEPRRHEEDVDNDGDIDLVFHFRLGDTSLTCDSTEGTLIGQTLDSQFFAGTDLIRMVQ